MAHVVARAACTARRGLRKPAERKGLGLRAAPRENVSSRVSKNSCSEGGIDLLVVAVWRRDSDDCGDEHRLSGQYRTSLLFSMG